MNDPAPSAYQATVRRAASVGGDVAGALRQWEGEWIPSRCDVLG